MIEVILHIMAVEIAIRKHADTVYNLAIRITIDDSDCITDSAIIVTIISMLDSHFTSLISNCRIPHLGIAGWLEIDIAIAQNLPKDFPKLSSSVHSRYLLSKESAGDT